MAFRHDGDTEFNDALRKHGILPPRVPEPRTPSPPLSPTLDDLLEDLPIPEIHKLKDNAVNDQDERAIDSHLRQRFLEEKARQQRARFGRVYPIGRDDYTREVTDASKENAPDDVEEKGTGVVCFLYKDGIPRSDHAFQHVRTLATRHPSTKFVSIVGDKCIPNLPDSRIPMFIVYRKGDIRNQIVAWGSDKERRIEELEALLVVAGAVEVEKRPSTDQVDSDIEDSEEERDNNGTFQRPSSSARGQRAIRGTATARRKDDADSDFEFDL
ncbi:hypothetical protein AMATHDRAFT_74277 [Amanita thiersii Skay4041]|uniref:Phosducin thioredoxin-like domain-containing protein n=1 Tax=Amanita thiersii Skay4041 TaxID=703135 RepID=A0A2A9NT21_9AGAR|nr:hypothetical protein AMATHDRAFT_74277 [Amanita thiersii Skay4041]